MLSLSIPELLTGKDEAIKTATGAIVNDDSQVVLTGYNQEISTDLGTTIVPGNIDVSRPGNSDLSNSGQINILGEKVGLFNAKLNASSINGSGNIRIGADSQSSGNVPHTTRTYVDARTEIYTKSFLGEGGNVVIRSNTSFFWQNRAISNIREQSVSTAQNSTSNRVEVSSQRSLIFDGTVNLDSASTLGNLIFHAENINIVDTNIEDNYFIGETATASQISKSSVENISEYANITFKASDYIVIDN